MRRGLSIEIVEPGSVADEMGLENGDRILAINGHRIRDIIDFGFYSGEDELLLEVEKKDGEVWELELEREEGEPLGIRFAPPKPVRCANSCVFCFVDQLPKGLRGPLYVKDEDYRLSFLYGNFITLSSIRKGELRRIKEQRLSPLYISVHCTDPELRGEMLGNPAGPPILEILRDLAAAGITMHTQVVLCPGLNDGPYLERTVRDLAGLFPRVASLAVVPVGLTRHRASLPVLRPVTREYAAGIISEWLPRALQLAERLGKPFLFLADEFFVKADAEFPPLAVYGDLPQIENGVGMLPLFLADAAEVLDRAEQLSAADVTIVTGESPYHYLADFLTELSEKTGITFHLRAMRNTLFGESVTVTGLVPGKEVLERLRGRDVGDLLAIPDVMLREGDGVFIDDVSTEELHAELGTDVEVFEATPSGLYEMLVRRFGT
jgi:putative radical SAM enzyme (TIGR03279 family)